MDARQYLRDLMGSFVDSYEAAGSPDLQAARHRLTGAARALVWTGELQADQVHDVLGEFDDLLEARGLLDRVVQRSEASGSVSATRTSGTPDAPRARSRGPSELRSVLPINERLAELDGYVVSAISLEVWSDHLSFRYAVQGEVRRLLRSDGGWPDWQWEVNDDLGNVYERSGMNAGSGGSGLVVGDVNFRGPVTADARRIAVRLHHQDQGPTSVLVDLPGHDR